jgi:hypothetical protein
MLSGTWKLNTAKSKYSPGPAPKSVTTVISMDGDWVVAKTEGVGSEGKSMSYTNRYKLDGKEYAYKTAVFDGTISLKRIDDRHEEATLKSAKGNVAGKGVISKDGKTRTLTTTGTNSEGKPVHNVAVYDKQ